MGWPPGEEIERVGNMILAKCREPDTCFVIGSGSWDTAALVTAMDELERAGLVKLSDFGLCDQTGGEQDYRVSVTPKGRTDGFKFGANGIDV